MTDFDALLTALASNDVDFIVVGGAAAIAHGSARLTQDLAANVHLSDLSRVGDVVEF